MYNRERPFKQPFGNKIVI